MKFTKVLALFLALMLCVCAFAGCNNGNTPADDGNKNDDKNTGNGTTVSIKIIDQNENVIYENSALEVDLSLDAAEDGKLYIGQVLSLCEYWADEQVELNVEYTDDENGFVSINGLEEKRVVEQEEQIVETTEDETDDGSGDTATEGEEEKEPEIIVVDVEYWYYWTMMIGENEVGVDSEIKLGDVITLTYAKDNVADLIEG